MATGYVNANLAFPQQKVVATVTRFIADIAGYVPFEEQHTDSLEITEHPIEQGARIADHAFKRPSQVVIKFGWSNSSFGGTSGASHSGSASGQIASIYQSLLALQASRVPFALMTGKRLYQNMLLAELSVQTDRETENALMVTATFKEVILVTTSTVKIDKAETAPQASPQATQAPVNAGPRQLAPSTTVNRDSANTVIGGR